MGRADDTDRIIHNKRLLLILYNIISQSLTIGVDSKVKVYFVYQLYGVAVV